MTATPLYATPHTPDRDHLGPEAVNLARLLGFELMPWQLDAVELLTEMEGGRFVYTDATLCVGRRNGKTEGVILPLLLLQALGTPGSHCWYGAQTLKDARAMLIETWLPLLDASPLSGTYTVRKASGSESLTFKTGSTISLITSTSKVAGHGANCDLYVQDEAFSLPDSRMEVALRPAMSTRTLVGGGPRMLVVSTAGTPTTSPYLLARVEHGRQLVADGVTRGTAFIEYAAPEGSDPSDPAVWRACNPAIDITITEDAVRSEYQTMDKTDFQRSRLCMWTVASSDPVISLETWDSLVDISSRRGPQLALAFDSSPDGAHSSIGVASLREDGLVHVEVVAMDEGTGWLATEVERLYKAHRPYLVVCDSRSPAANALPALLTANVPITELPTSERPNAFAAFTATANERRIRHLGQAQLTESLIGAVRKPSGDSFAWSRRSSAVDISPLVACTMATYILLARPRQEIGVWSLDRVVADKRSREWRPNAGFLRQISALLDGRPEERLVQKVIEVGYQPDAAADIVAWWKENRENRN